MKWTSPELKRFRASYPVKSRGELLKEFAPRTVGAIENMASRLKLRKKRDRAPAGRWRAICAQHKPMIFRGGGMTRRPRVARVNGRILEPDGFHTSANHWMVFA
jgi:hypothetical protein